MGRIFDAVRGALDAQGLRYDIIDGQTAVRFGYATEHARWACVAEVREADELIVFVSVLADRCAPEHRLAIAELFTRINYGLAVGNFEMDWNDGEMRFRTSVDVEGSPATPALVRQLVGANVTTMGRYLATIGRVARGEVEPAAALAPPSA